MAAIAIPHRLDLSNTNNTRPRMPCQAAAISLAEISGQATRRAGAGA
jgi:hypothetical protein